MIRKMIYKVVVSHVRLNFAMKPCLLTVIVINDFDPDFGTGKHHFHRNRI